jgi:hypothetical protein
MKIREAGPEDAEGIASVHISNASVAITDMGRRAGYSLITVWPEGEAKGFYENLGFKPIFKGYRVILSAEAEPDFYLSGGEPPESPPFPILLGRYQCSWQHWRLDASNGQHDWRQILLGKVPRGLGASPLVPDT